MGVGYREGVGDYLEFSIDTLKTELDKKVLKLSHMKLEVRKC